MVRQWYKLKWVAWDNRLHFFAFADVTQWSRSRNSVNQIGGYLRCFSLVSGHCPQSCYPWLECLQRRQWLHPSPVCPMWNVGLCVLGGGEDSVEFSIDELSTLLGGPEPGVLHPHLGSSTLLHCSCICEMGWVRGPSTGLRARLDEGGVYARKTKLLSLQSGGQCYSPESPRV